MDPPSNTQLDFTITVQPDEITCGPACLHAVYRYYGDAIPLDEVINEAQHLPGGGTLAVMLGLHALQRGYDARIYTCDLVMFDPSWFGPAGPPLQERLRAQADAKDDSRVREATCAYLEFLDKGGQVWMEDITPDLMASFLAKGVPVVVGLSATWLYRCTRERPADLEFDDVRGQPTGHFVVIHGLDLSTRTASVADPYCHHPHPGSHSYKVGVDRLIGAVLLGIVTFDVKMLIVTPRASDGEESVCPS